MTENSLKMGYIWSNMPQNSPKRLNITWISLMEGRTDDTSAACHENSESTLIGITHMTHVDSHSWLMSIQFGLYHWIGMALPEIKEEAMCLCFEIQLCKFSDSNPYSGVELRPWTFQWDLTLHLLIWTVLHINRYLHQWIDWHKSTL